MHLFEREGTIEKIARDVVKTITTGETLEKLSEVKGWDFVHRGELWEVLEVSENAE